jgi:hypothetical protein
VLLFDAHCVTLLAKQYGDVLFCSGQQTFLQTLELFLGHPEIQKLRLHNHMLHALGRRQEVSFQIGGGGAENIFSLMFVPFNIIFTDR